VGETETEWTDMVVTEDKDSSNVDYSRARNKEEL
jgi:hypothetical protein